MGPDQHGLGRPVVGARLPLADRCRAVLQHPHPELPTLVGRPSRPHDGHTALVVADHDAEGGGVVEVSRSTLPTASDSPQSSSSSGLPVERPPWPMSSAQPAIAELQDMVVHPWAAETPST